MSYHLTAPQLDTLKTSFIVGDALRIAAQKAECSSNTARRYFHNWRGEKQVRQESATQPIKVADYLSLRASDILQLSARYRGGLLWDQRRNWPAEDIAALIALCERGTNPDRISPILAREPNAIVWKAHGLGLSLSAAWRSFIYKRRKLTPRAVAEPLLQYPYIVGKAKNDSAFLLAVNAVVPHGLPGDLRNDVCQDMVLAILEGDLSPDDIAAEMPKYLKGARKRYSMPWGTVNIDAPLWDDGRPLAEVISENRLYQ